MSIWPSSLNKPSVMMVIPFKSLMIMILSILFNIEMVSFTKDVAKVNYLILFFFWKEMEGQRDLFEYPNLNFKYIFSLI